MRDFLRIGYHRILKDNILGYSPFFKEGLENPYKIKILLKKGKSIWLDYEDDWQQKTGLKYIDGQIAMEEK